MGLWSKGINRSKTGLLRLDDDIHDILGCICNFFDDLLGIQKATFTCNSQTFNMKIKNKYDTKLCNINFNIPEDKSHFNFMSLIYKHLDIIIKNNLCDDIDNKLIDIQQVILYNLDMFRKTHNVKDLYLIPTLYSTKTYDANFYWGWGHSTWIN